MNILLYSIFLFLFAINQIRSISDICTLPAKKGNCKGHFERYFFNQLTGRCEKFIYGGCHGNKNNFYNLEDCRRICAIQSISETCSLPAVKGDCLGHFERYYWNQKDGKCQKFIYGGCHGNRNNFNSLDDCIKICGVESIVEICSLPAKKGNCTGHFSRYFWNQNTGSCQKFVYGGCNGNGNNFKSIHDCRNICGNHAVEACNQPVMTGGCGGHFERYYWNKKSGKCEKFIYGGCHGNRNNFYTLEDCQKLCK